MDRLLDIDSEPPYVEVFQYAPLMYLSLCDFEVLSTTVPALEWLKWLHQVHCTIDAVATECGVYKVKSVSQGGSCAFSISPDMPPREQAAILHGCAKKLLQAINKMSTPRGQPLAAQLTIHAGQFAGGVIGRGSWTYDLFGEQVTALVAMDSLNTRNNIQVSADALQLMPDPQEFELSYKMDADLIAGRPSAPGASIRMYALKAGAGEGPHGSAEQYAGDSTQQAGADGSSVAAAGSRRGAGVGLSDASPADVGWGAAGVSAAGAAWDQGLDLTYRDAELELAYGRYHSQGLVCLDHVFILLSFLVCFSCCWGTAWGQGWPPVLWATFGTVLACPALALVLYVCSPPAYLNWRETIWSCHRVVRLVTLLLVEASSSQHALLARWMRFAAVGMLLDALGFKVRFKTHCLLTSLNITLWLAVTWVQLLVGTTPQLLQGMLQMLLGLGLPCLLLYHWELDQRRGFCSGCNAKVGKGHPATSSKVASKLA